MVTMIRCLLVLGLLLAAAPLSADTLAGRVVAVADGDTITIRDGGRHRHTVWLAGIDAPKSKQPFAQASKQHLTQLVSDKDVSVEWQSRDRYGRIVGKVTLAAPDCPGCTTRLDAGLAQLEAGMAWWDRDYRRQQTLEDQGRYEYAEFDARMKRVGLWQDPTPIPPAEWRKRETPSWLTWWRDPSRSAGAAIPSRRSQGTMARAISTPGSTLASISRNWLAADSAMAAPGWRTWGVRSRPRMRSNSLRTATPGCCSKTISGRYLA
jgi:endonuclease YncB( thermonuclease family)